MPAQENDSLKLEDHRSAAAKEWDDPATIAAWRKWRADGRSWSQGVTDAVVTAAAVRPGHRVLDLASGSGQPAISLAKAVAPGGHVTATDMSAGMLKIAEECAAREGLSNMTFRQADAENLPFADGEFDAVTCRYGVMFFPDPVRALRDCRRVLKPGGRVVFVAWGSADQAFFGATVGTLKKYVELPRPEPGAPHVFRFSEPGALGSVLSEAGFENVQSEPRSIPIAWLGPPEEFWEQFRESAAPFRKSIESLAPDIRRRLDADVLSALSKYYDGQQVRFNAEVVLATGVRPAR
jgi:ubiquinone/menaquinone biosynthesis C-methylase UbiE